MGMELGDVFSVRGMAFVAAFAAAAVLASAVNFSPHLLSFGQTFTIFQVTIHLPPALAAQNQSYTLLQFIGPMAGGFLGIAGGALAMVLAQSASFAMSGNVPDNLSLLRFLPMVFAAMYFASYSSGKSFHLVPLACIALFVLHPIGYQAWYFSLFWLIPAIAVELPEHLFLRSLGATFSAHAIWAVTLLYFTPTTADFWLGLIPVVVVERFLFACGITLSFVAFNNVLAHIGDAARSGLDMVDSRYLFFAKRK